MNNKLAENMLRFGIKNLKESEVEKLQGLAEQSGNAGRTAFLDFLGKFDPVAASVVKNNKSGVTVSKKYVLRYVPGGNDEDDGSGTLYVFKVGTAVGMPYIQYYGQVINRGVGNGDVSDIIIGQQYEGTFNINDYPGGYNEVWNKLDNRKTQDVIEGAFQFIQNDLAKFKTAFHQVTRSGLYYKSFWNDNPQTFDNSQYGMWRKKFEGNALKVIKLVQDDGLMKNILFKTNPANWRNDGKYDLTIPPSF